MVLSQVWRQIMARLQKHNNTQQEIMVHIHHTFGRSSKSDTVFTQGDISHLHALIRWTGHQWKLFNYSKNGSSVNNVTLNEEQSIELTEGDTITFGTQEQWCLTDASAPQSFIQSYNNNTIIELDALHVLPSEEQPDITLYKVLHNQWVCENSTTTTPLSSGDTISCEEDHWIFTHNDPIEDTLDSHPIITEQNYLQFSVTPDEESVVITYHHNGETIDLGERVHHYILLVLARLRLEDHNKGEIPENQGWIDIDQLLEMLNVKRKHFNIQLYRLRQQVTQLFPQHPLNTTLVERRAQKIRMGYPRFTIIGGCGTAGSLTV